MNDEKRFVLCTCLLTAAIGFGLGSLACYWTGEPAVGVLGMIAFVIGASFAHPSLERP